MTKVKLPDNLKGKEYEDAVSAYIKALGYFVENRVILDHYGKELLELDTVATPINQEYLNRILIDAKSGKKTGFADIFKIYGWKKFLDIKKGCIVRKEHPEEKDENALQEFQHELEIEWAVFNIDNWNLDTNIEDILPSIISKDEVIFNILFITGWWFNITERIIYREYKRYIKGCTNKTLINQVKEYEKACMLSFFEKDPIKRVLKLYDAFKEIPNISDKCITHASIEKNENKLEIQNKIFDTEELLWIQYVVLLEQRVRILIIKCAVEILFKKEKNVWQGLKYEHLVQTTPRNFINGIKKLEELDSYEKVPYLLQIFLENFGGFYIDNKKDIEFISDAVSLSFEEIKKYLNVINTFFPTKNTWFQSSKDIMRLKFAPLICRGVGAFCRDYYYDEDYDELSNDGMGWLIRKYHNNIIKVLKKDLAVDE